MSFQQESIVLSHSFITALIQGKISIELLEDESKNISLSERDLIKEFIELYYSSDISNPTIELIDISSKIFELILRLRLDGILVGEIPTSFLSKKN